jgi:hypothetical protein
MNTFVGLDNLIWDIPFSCEIAKRISSVDTESVVLTDISAESDL